MNLLIRSETAADRSAIYQVNKLAFEQESEARLVDLLRESDAFIPGLSLVAVLDNQIVGHILFSRIHIVSDTGNKVESIALAPVAVLPQFQKQGIGKLLIKRGLDDACTLNYESVIVLGHPEYYPKFGFVPAEKWNIKAPFNVPSEAFMALELIPGKLDNVSGIVEYAKEFQEIS
mgnify:CR=1 FL=1